MKTIIHTTGLLCFAVAIFPLLLACVIMRWSTS